jgi:hypothetical protein
MLRSNTININPYYEHTYCSGASESKEGAGGLTAAGGGVGDLTVEVDCAPLHIGISQLMDPYFTTLQQRMGDAAYWSMRGYEYGGGIGHRRVSKDQFTALWRILHYSTFLNSASFDDDRDSKGAMTRCRVASPSLSWVMRTLWGSTVAVQISRGDSTLSRWGMEIRCTDRETLKAVVNDSSHFMSALLD